MAALSVDMAPLLDGQAGTSEGEAKKTAEGEEIATDNQLEEACIFALKLPVILSLFSVQRSRNTEMWILTPHCLYEQVVCSSN